MAKLPVYRFPVRSSVTVDIDMAKIDEAMAKNPKISAAQMADVKKFRTEGEAFHKAGKHQESVDTLAKAMKILGI